MKDVVVIGGGPAGAATSLHLARLGLSVVLIDGASFPRRKPCGEGLFPAGVAELGDLLPLETAVPTGCRLEGLRFSHGQRSVRAPLGSDERPARSVERLRLDEALLEAAAGAGVDVRIGVAARGLREDDRRYASVDTDSGSLRARAIAAADGLGSRLRRQAGLDLPARQRRYGVSAHVGLRAPASPDVHVHFARRHEVYFTPLGDHLANLAVLGGRDTMSLLAGDRDGGFTRLVAAHPALAGGWELLDEPRAAGPFPAACQQAWRKNLVLAGDAAGFFDGVTGEGMSLALVSARLCATAIAAYLASGLETAFLRYDRLRRALALPSTLLGRLTLAIAARPPIAAVALRNLERRPAAFGRLAALSAGELPLSALRPSDALALTLGL